MKGLPNKDFQSRFFNVSEVTSIFQDLNSNQVQEWCKQIRAFGLLRDYSQQSVSCPVVTSLWGTKIVWGHVLWDWTPTNLTD